MQNVEELSNAIVRQAADDYRKVFLGYAIEGVGGFECSKRELDEFFYSDWYKKLTNLNADRLLQMLRIDELTRLLDFLKCFVGSNYKKSVQLSYYEKESSDTKSKPKLVKMNIPPIFMDKFLETIKLQITELEKMLDWEKDDLHKRELILSGKSEEYK